MYLLLQDKPKLILKSLKWLSQKVSKTLKLPHPSFFFLFHSRPVTAWSPSTSGWNCCAPTVTPSPSTPTTTPTPPGNPARPTPCLQQTRPPELCGQRDNRECGSSRTHGGRHRDGAIGALRMVWGSDRAVSEVGG